MKLKRLFAAVLSTALALSLCAMPAMAEGASNKSTFDPSITSGTLTIHKYEQTSEQAGTNSKGTPLEGVEFTVYKLADIAQENNKLVYKPVAALNGTLADANFNNDATATGAIDSRALYAMIQQKLDVGKIDLNTLTHKSQTTGEDSTLGAGTVKITNLDLGIYMVAETKAPSQILTKSANFIVSIPMTEKQTDGTYTWNYDVVAEPKNVPIYGGVTLIKTGRVAGQSVDTGISGVLFRLDIKNGAAWEPVDLDKVTIATGTKVQTSSTTSIVNKGQIKTAADGHINITTGLAPATYRFVELEAVDGYIADTTKATEFEVYNDAGAGLLKVKMGTDDNVSSINITNERPDLEKNIVKRDGTPSANHDADYGIGDNVPYTLTVKVPDTIAFLNVFKITDEVKAAELYYNKDFVLTYKDDAGNTQKLDAKYYEITYTNDNKETTDGARTFTIDFKPTGVGKGLTDAFKDKTITINYTAELLPGAKITNEGNINSAKLEYSNKTNNTVEGGDTPNINTNEIQDAGVVYTFQTGILKVDESGAALSDVTFDLYKMCDANDQPYRQGTTQAGIVLNGKNLTYITDVAKLGLDRSKYWVKVGTLTSNADGKDAIKGLVEGTYKLVETKTKEGYNLLKEPVDATLTVSYAENWTKTDSYVNGKLVKRTFKTSGSAFNDSDASPEIKVINRKGFTLPVTGGFGTLLFSGIGVLLVLAGVGVLFSLKKKSNRA